MLTRWWWCFLWGWFWVFSRSNFISTFFMFFSHFYSLCSPCSFPILSVFFPLCFFVGLFQFYFHSLLLWCIVLSPEMTVGWGSMFARCRWCFCYMGSSRISPFCFTCSDGLDEVRAQSSGVVVFFPDLSLHIYNYIYIYTYCWLLLGSCIPSFGRSAVAPTSSSSSSVCCQDAQIGNRMGRERVRQFSDQELQAWYLIQTLWPCFCTVAILSLFNLFDHSTHVTQDERVCSCLPAGGAKPLGHLWMGCGGWSGVIFMLAVHLAWGRPGLLHLPVWMVQMAKYGGRARRAHVPGNAWRTV